MAANTVAIQAVLLFLLSACKNGEDPFKNCHNIPMEIVADAQAQLTPGLEI